MNDQNHSMIAATPYAATGQSALVLSAKVLLSFGGQHIKILVFL